ncbi:MAG: S9 family peptidase [Phycisphaerales bacterium]|nr:MAG: S9 family peptidase [Phycisphaerales bacterium]
MLTNTLLIVAISASTVLGPPPTRIEPVVEELHGVEVVDNYRWLEASVKESEEVADWVAVQNEATFAFLESIPQRDAIRQRLTELWDYERFGTPFKEGGRYYFYKNDGLQNQYVLYRLDSLDDEPTVLFDPNTWSEDGTVAMSGTEFSDDGRYVAYGIAEAGSDWQTWRVHDIDAGRDLPEEIRWVKWGGFSWTRDSKGFFYSRYDAPEGGDMHLTVNKFQKVFYHRAGTAQADDVLVYHTPDHPDWGFQTTVSEDGRYLIIAISTGTDDRYRIMYKDLTEPYGMPVELIGNFEADYSFVGNDGPVFYFRNNLHAPLGRLIAIDIRRPEMESWKTIIPECEDTLRSVSLVGNLFIASYLQDAKSAVRVFAMDGSLVREIVLPGIGSVSGFGGRRTDTETFFSFASFTTPPTVYHYDVVTGRSEVFARTRLGLDVSDYVTEQVFYESKDGTRVPMFICHKKGIELDGNNPTLLYGYGGYNHALTPYFSIQRIAWMEMGGIFAVANIRGGGEYGEKWHKAAIKLNRQKAFDDFIAAAEWLIENDYTQTKKLAIQGASNGGLLVGACMTQRPDLFGACLPAVGVMDMLRFHKFTIGWAWVDDFGSPDNPEEFKALLAYSPYHNIRLGTAYPATLATTADTDDRVVPGHSFKFTAAMQAAQAGDAPILIRIETRAGHGGGKPTAKVIEETADEWAFLVKTLDMQLPADLN